MKNTIQLYTFVLLVSISYTAHAQHVDNIINTYKNAYPFEQVYVQLDNNLYSGGDTIWFKAYVLQNALPSIFSANLYADWFDASGKLLLHQTYPITQGRSNGQFAVPLVYTGNTIHLLAYTKWMLNEDSNVLFHKTISILPAKTIISSTSSENKIEPQKIVLQFFPEGGNLVAGIINKIAFKATDQYGYPIDLNGTIKDNYNNVVSNFATMHAGMGYFYLTPNASTHYVAEYNAGLGIHPTANLPAIQSSGINMEVNIEPDDRLVTIRKKQDEKFNVNNIHLLATINGTVVYLSNINLANEDSIISAIATNALPSGILIITVLDNNWNPLAERISFVRSQDINNNIPQLSFTTKSLDKKGLNTFSLQYADSVEANLSIAITDARIPADTSNNIISYLLLTNQLKGNVNNPAYYFEDSSLQRQEELDLVMLTNGWRKYNWHGIVQGNEPVIKYKRDSTYFFLEGNIESEKEKFPQQLSFFVNSKTMFGSFSLNVNNNRSFGDSTMIIYDTTIISCKTINNNSRLNYMQLPKETYTVYPFKTNKNLVTKATQFLQTIPLDFYKTSLPDVTVTTYKKQYVHLDDSVEEQYESIEIRNATPLKSVYVANDPILTSYGGFDGFRQFILARLHFDINHVPPYLPGLRYFVNEQMIPQNAALETPVSDIVFIKLFEHCVNVPGNGAALFIYTKQGYASEQPVIKKIPPPKIIGYTISKEFYSPDYSTIKNKDEMIDNRKTLYWNPHINLDNKENKTINLSFYNNNLANKFRIIIEGIKADGTPIHIEEIVE